QTVMVPETHMVERQYKVCVPTYREEQCRQTVMVPEVHEENRQCTYTVYQTRWHEEKRRQTVMVPETSLVEKQYNVCVPTWQEKQCRHTVMVPEVHEENRQCTYTVYHSVPETRTREVCCYTQVATAVCDPCTGVVRTVCQLVPQVQTVCETVYRCVPEQKT